MYSFMYENRSFIRQTSDSVNAFNITIVFRVNIEQAIVFGIWVKTSDLFIQFQSHTCGGVLQQKVSP